MWLALTWPRPGDARLQGPTSGLGRAGRAPAHIEGVAPGLCSHGVSPSPPRPQGALLTHSGTQAAFAGLCTCSVAGCRVLCDSPTGCTKASSPLCATCPALSSQRWMPARETGSSRVWEAGCLCGPVTSGSKGGLEWPRAVGRPQAPLWTPLARRETTSRCPAQAHWLLPRPSLPRHGAGRPQGPWCAHLKPAAA